MRSKPLQFHRFVLFLRLESNCSTDFNDQLPRKYAFYNNEQRDTFYYLTNYQKRFLLYHIFLIYDN